MTWSKFFIFILETEVQRGAGSLRCGWRSWGSAAGLEDPTPQPQEAVRTCPQRATPLNTESTSPFSWEHHLRASFRLYCPRVRLGEAPPQAASPRDVRTHAFTLEKIREVRHSPRQAQTAARSKDSGLKATCAFYKVNAERLLV